MILRRFALAVALGLTTAASTQAMAQSVLYIARPAIALSVSDRAASRQSPVEFTVTMPGGKTTTATAAPQMGGERAGTVHYPSDFGNAGMHVGDYSWTARIAGKVVISGKFSFRPSKDGQLLFVPS